MKRLYEESGFSVKLDYTFNCCSQSFAKQLNENDYDEPVNYVIGFLSGVSSKNKIVVYAVSICAGERKEQVK